MDSRARVIKLAILPSRAMCEVTTVRVHTLARVHSKTRAREPLPCTTRSLPDTVNLQILLFVAIWLLHHIVSVLVQSDKESDGSAILNDNLHSELRAVTKSILPPTENTYISRLHVFMSHVSGQTSSLAHKFTAARNRIGEKTRTN